MNIFETVRVRNTTETKTLNVERVLSEPLELRIDKSKPAVLIFHTHTTETYQILDKGYYSKKTPTRTNDNGNEEYRTEECTTKHLLVKNYRYEQREDNQQRQRKI